VLWVLADWLVLYLRIRLCLLGYVFNSDLHVHFMFNKKLNEC
jgi:hypothetical protein